MKILKNRIFLALVCGILAVLCVLGYAGSVRSEAQTAQVVRFTCSAAKGDRITDDMVETVTVGAYHLASGLETSKDAVVGKYAAADFVKGDLIPAEKLTDTLENAPDALSTLDGTRLAFSVTVKEFSDGLSDKLRGGDIVSVIAAGENGSAVIPPELTYVEVLAVTDGTGVDKQKSDTGEEKETVKTVTLLATPAQAVKLAGYEDSAEIHFALVYRGDSETAQKFLDKESEVLNSGTAHSGNG